MCNIMYSVHKLRYLISCETQSNVQLTCNPYMYRLHIVHYTAWYVIHKYSDKYMHTIRVDTIHRLATQITVHSKVYGVRRTLYTIQSSIYIVCRII